ncbi:LOW QUALITY PROTEIN: trichohyalin-like [Gossypium hirsutum]|uniref:LOW QUALITY PROTEIN: trichohyalin-like n=1 Tax=Gossypium hirsutum TaxID=3635 RepID=A0ABM2YKH7_GOSHI|nr:LOW QUALITY PROTEIN: trichohyalin-like [Gossypium hirsutum]
MVKKKVTHQSNDPKQRNPSQEIHDPAKDSTFTKASNPLSRQSSMEDPKEKLQNLKSLNSLLVKEAFESRQQIDSLVQAKEALEVELIERKKLEAEESEKNVSVELQNGLVSVYMVNQMKELGVERETVIGALKNKVSGLIGSLEEEREMLSLVCEERDLVRNDFELQVNEGKLMKEKLTEMEGNERKFVEEIGKLKVEYDRLVWEKEELEKVKSSMVKDRNLLEKNMTDMAGEVEHLRRENEKVVREKKEIEIEKNEQRVKIDEMEKEMSEVILSFRKEDGVLRSKIFELEKNCGEAMDREAERAIEIGALVEEKRAKERRIERLMEEKDFMSRSLEAIMVESEDRQRRIEKLLEESDANRRALEMNEKELRDMHKKIKELLGDKTEIEDKIHGENENIKLHNEVSELRNIVHRLQEECLDHQKKKDELVSEVSRFKALVDQITLERDNALKGFDKEKHNGVNLRSKVSEMENMLKKTEEELARKRTEWQNLIEEKKEMGSHIGSLAEDKDRLYLELLETKRSFNDLRAKMESTTINYERALTLLKNTASLLCQSKDEKSPEEAAIAEQKLEDEIELYAMELEAIKKAFKNKETVAQDLKQKVELLEKSMVEAQKKKSFWTLVSSATTLLAAITVAYAARGR